jgi:hypothetical protein
LIFFTWLHYIYAEKKDAHCIWFRTAAKQQIKLDLQLCKSQPYGSSIYMPYFCMHVVPSREEGTLEYNHGSQLSRSEFRARAMAMAQRKYFRIEQKHGQGISRSQISASNPSRAVPWIHRHRSMFEFDLQSSPEICRVSRTHQVRWCVHVHGATASRSPQPAWDTYGTIR